MRSPIGRLGIAVCVCAAFVGCGSSGSSDSGSSEGGGTLTGTYTSFPEYLDPALNFTLEGATALQNVYIPLLTYAHGNGSAGTKLIPGLAQSLPKIDQGGKRYTLSLRPGLRYSDGSPVKASDFRFAIERLFRVNSAGSTFYTGIVGAQKFAETKKGGIPGIVTDDESGQIVIHLTAPSGVFSFLLGLPYSAPLPADTPNEDQTANPPPATGPYVITGVKPGRSWEYERNPFWEKANSEAMPDLPSGHVDAIEFKVQGNQSAQVNEVEQDKVDWMKNPPPADRYAQVKEQFEGSQFRQDPTISIYYFWMNTQQPPFDDLKVRQAVNYAVDPAALQRIYAGTLSPTQQVLPPQMPGYRKFELYPHNLAKAKELVAAADPSDRQVSVWTINLPPGNEAGEYLQQVLEKIGFDVKLKVIDAANYFTLISNTHTPELDIGWGNWLLDYPHPNDYFQPQLSGESILPVGNSNWAMFDDPAVNRKIKELAAVQLGPKQEREYAALDREVMKQAPWAPFGNLTLGTFVSDKIDLDKVIVSPIFGQDLTSFEFK
ncbi:MAG TPA: ABC transporter substrate-binding protein [Solirubrobacterales bacterium]|nr:ABC transporter substrate-binding protein [Solirubrobacterales bacterium]